MALIALINHLTRPHRTRLPRRLQPGDAPLALHSALPSSWARRFVLPTNEQQLQPEPQLEAAERG